MKKFNDFAICETRHYTMIVDKKLSNLFNSSGKMEKSDDASLMFETAICVFTFFILITTKKDVR